MENNYIAERLYSLRGTYVKAIEDKQKGKFVIRTIIESTDELLDLLSHIEKEKAEGTKIIFEGFVVSKKLTVKDSGFYELVDEMFKLVDEYDGRTFILNLPENNYSFKNIKFDLFFDKANSVALIQRVKMEKINIKSTDIIAKVAVHRTESKKISVDADVKNLVLYPGGEFNAENINLKRIEKIELVKAFNVKIPDVSDTVKELTLLECKVSECPEKLVLNRLFNIVKTEGIPENFEIDLNHGNIELKFTGINRHSWLGMSVEKDSFFTPKTDFATFKNIKELQIKASPHVYVSPVIFNTKDIDKFVFSGYFYSPEEGVSFLKTGRTCNKVTIKLFETKDLNEKHFNSFFHYLKDNIKRLNGINILKISGFEKHLNKYIEKYPEKYIKAVDSENFLFEFKNPLFRKKSFSQLYEECGNNFKTALNIYLGTHKNYDKNEIETFLKGLKNKIPDNILKLMLIDYMQKVEKFGLNTENIKKDLNKNNPYPRLK